jgi:hypothetical protein
MPRAEPAGQATGTSRLILLGTGGGPTPKPNRSASAQAIIVNGATYLVDCGNGVGVQMTKAHIKFSSLRNIFITHLHSDHAADYGNVLLLGWATDLVTPVDTYGPPPLTHMTELFLEMNDVDIRTRIADEGRPPLAELIHPHELTAPGTCHAGRQRHRDRGAGRPSADRPGVCLSLRLPRSLDRDLRRYPACGFADRPRQGCRRAGARSALPAGRRRINRHGAQCVAPEGPHDGRAHDDRRGGKGGNRGRREDARAIHFVPGGYPFIADSVWYDAVRPHFAGNLIVGHDLQEL